MAQPLLTPAELSKITVSLEQHRVTLGKRIKSGGRAHIYRGEDTLSNGRVIVRIARKMTSVSDLADNWEGLRALLGGCPQGFLVPIRPIVYDDKSWCISIWEQCDHNLADTQSLYTVQELLAHFRNLAQALDYLHRMGFTHCDVTPSNILFSSGLARLSDYDLLLKHEDKSNHSFDFRGTKRYSAPDFNSPAIVTADLWSLAVCYAEARCGRYPFEDKDPTKDTPSLKGMGLEEREVVSLALSKRHQDRFRVLGSSHVESSHTIHSAWVSALEKAVRDDGLTLFRSEVASVQAKPAQLTFGIHGVRESGKTTFLAMTYHKRAGLSTIEKDRIPDLRVVPAPDQDGVGTSTQEYLATILEEIRTSGSPQPTNLNFAKELRFDVSIGRTHANIIVEDYAGEIVELAPSPRAHNYVPARMDQIAKCDVQLLFIPIDREGEEVQHAVDKLRGYLLQAAKANPNRPRPVICVIYTKADTVDPQRLNINSAESVADFRDNLRASATYESVESNLSEQVVDPSTLRNLSPDAIILPFIVSAYGKRQGGDFTKEYHNLRPVNIWVPFGCAVELVKEILSDWCDEKLQKVKDAIENGRLAEANQALTRSIALIKPYFQKYPEAVLKIEAVRIDLNRRSHLARMTSLRRAAIYIAVACSVLLSGALGYNIFTTQKALHIFASASSAVDALSQFDFRERYSRRKQLLGAWYADKRYIGPELRSRQEKLLQTDYGLIEDSDLEAMVAFRDSRPGVNNARERLDTIHLCETRVGRHAEQYVAMERADLQEMEDADLDSMRSARERLAGSEHASERLGLLDKVQSRNGSHKAKYDEWEALDRDEKYWTEEAKAVASLLGHSDSFPSHVLDEVSKYREKFTRSSKSAEIAKMEMRAKDALMEMQVAAAYENAMSVESSNASHIAVLRAWREFVTFAGPHPKAREAEKRIRDRESVWDIEEYSDLIERYLTIAKFGDSAPKADIANFTAATAKYLGADRSLKRMEAEVRISWERASRLSNGTAEATITLESLTIPYWSNFWSQWSTTEITEIGVATGVDQGTFTVNVKEFGLLFSPSVEQYTKGNVLTLKCAWGDSFNVVVSEKNDTSSPGTQKATIRMPRNQRTTLTLTPVVKSEPSAKVTFYLECNEFDLTRLSLPAYTPLKGSK